MKINAFVQVIVKPFFKLFGFTELFSEKKRLCGHNMEQVQTTKKEVKAREPAKDMLDFVNGLHTTDAGRLSIVVMPM